MHGHETVAKTTSKTFALCTVYTYYFIYFDAISFLSKKNK